MIYELIKFSGDYSAKFTPILSQRLKDLLLDYQRGHDVDRDEIIDDLVTEYIYLYEEVNAQLNEMETI